MTAASSPVVGEEVAKTNASGWQAAGWTGAGVKVGILDSSTRPSWDNAAANGDLPAAPAGSLLPVNGSACNAFGFTGPGTEHGVGVAEIVHEQAPDAQLYIGFIFSLSDMQAAVNYFAGQGVKIITRSGTGNYDGPGNGTGPAASVIDSAFSQGMAFFQSAGNNAGPNAAGFGAYWRGSWADANSDGYLEFSGGDEGLQFSCGPLLMGFRWSDWGTPASDRTNYDIFVYDKVVGGVPTTCSRAAPRTSRPARRRSSYRTTAATQRYHRHFLVQRVATGTGSAGDVLEWEKNGGSIRALAEPVQRGRPGSRHREHRSTHGRSDGSANRNDDRALQLVGPDQ